MLFVLLDYFKIGKMISSAILILKLLFFILHSLSTIMFGIGGDDDRRILLIYFYTKFLNTFESHLRSFPKLVFELLKI